MYVADVEDFDDDAKDEEYNEKATGPNLYSANKPLMAQSKVNSANTLRNSRMRGGEGTTKAIQAESNDPSSVFADGSKIEKVSSSLMRNCRSSVKSEGIWNDTRETNESAEKLESGVISSDKPAVVSFHSTSGEYSVSKSSDGKLLLLVNGKLFRHVEEEDIEEKFSHKTSRISQTENPLEKYPPRYAEKEIVNSLFRVSRSSKLDSARRLMASVVSTESRNQTDEAVGQSEILPKTQEVSLENWSHDAEQVKVSKISKSLERAELHPKPSGDLQSAGSNKQIHLLDNLQNSTALECTSHQLDKCHSFTITGNEQATSKESNNLDVKCRDTTSRLKVTACSICDCMEKLKNECERVQEGSACSNKQISLRDNSQNSTASKCTSHNPRHQLDKCHSSTITDNEQAASKENNSFQVKCRDTTSRLYRAACSICDCTERLKNECERVQAGFNTRQESDACRCKTCQDDDSLKGCQLCSAGFEPEVTANVDSCRKKRCYCCYCKSKAKQNIFSNAVSRRKRCECEYVDKCRNYTSTYDTSGKISDRRNYIAKGTSGKAQERRNYTAHDTSGKTRERRSYTAHDTSGKTREHRSYTARGTSGETCDPLGPFGSVRRSSALAGKTCRHSLSRGSSCCSNDLMSTCPIDCSHPKPLLDCPDTVTSTQRKSCKDPKLKVTKTADVRKKQKKQKVPTACSQHQQYHSDFEDALIEKDGPTIIRSLLIDKDNHSNLQMIGEIAAQLEFRIVEYVFAGLDRKSSYGILVRNIPEVIEKSCTDVRVVGKVNLPLQFRLVKRFAYVKTSLRPFGYNFDFHPQFSIEMVNKYGRLVLSETQMKFRLSPIDLDVRKDLSSFIAANCSHSEIEHVTILLDCLLLLASDDGQSLFLWQQK